MNSNTELEENSEQSTDIHSFADALANDVVEEGIVDGCIEVVFQEEEEVTASQADLISHKSVSNPVRTSSSLSSSDSESLVNPELYIHALQHKYCNINLNLLTLFKETSGAETTELSSPLTGSSLLSNLIDILAWLLKPSIMARILLLVALFLCGGNLFNFIRDAYSQPKIVQAKAARPFFSNGSSKYLVDYYHGNMRPEYALKNTDLLIVMYYAQWSTESAFMKRIFEVNARMFSNKQSIKFIAINCWPVGSVCKSTYKITKFPIIAAYSNTVSLAYDGEHSIDHLYRWLRGLMNPILAVGSLEEITDLMAKYEKTVVAYFPFKNMQTPEGYRAYAAAGMLLSNGKSRDYSYKLVFTTSLSLARLLQLRYEGDLVMLKHNADPVFYPAMSRVAYKIVEWVRKEYINSSLTWIHRNRNENLFTDQFANILNNTAVIVLSDKIKAIYSSDSVVNVFQQVSEEYWQCNNITSTNSINKVTNNNDNTYATDNQGCEENRTVDEIVPCCRSLMSSIDWNIACASSTKYKWEGDIEVESEKKRRSLWVDEHIPLTLECKSRKNDTTADQLVHGCCTIYDTLGNKEMSTEQVILENINRAREQRNRQDGCMRSKLMNFMNYNTDVAHQYDNTDSINNTIRGFGCSKNSSLKFVVLDTNSYNYIVSKWGKISEKEPSVFIIDVGREIISPMTSKFSRANLQKFIQDYHSIPVQSAKINDDHLTSRFSNAKSITDGIMRETNQHQQLIKTNRTSFIHIVENEKSTSDEVVFFTGGRWHAPSATAIHVYHQINRYFSNSPDFIKFYTIDANRNDLPYNFNFDKLPAVVLFLSGRRDVSWKYPESLPLSLTNMLSFILSRSSPQLRWHTALSRCGKVCKTQNIHRLRRHRDVVLRDIRFLGLLVNTEKESYKYLRERRIAQLVTLSFTIRKMKHFEEASHLESINQMLSSREFRTYFSLIN